MSDLAVNTEAAVAVRARQSVQLTNEQLTFIANTEFVPKGLRGNVPAIMACVATGRALGLDDMAALRSINVIDGRPSFSAELMVLLVRRAGHSITGEVAPATATARGKRRDTGDEMTATWTLEMAARAGLANKQNWQKYPEAMLWARSVSQLCRMLFADVFVGGTYTPDELEGDDPPVVEESLPKLATQAQHAKLNAMLADLEDDPGVKLPDGHDSWTDFSRWVAKDKFHVESRAQLTVAQMTWLIDYMATDARAPF